MTASVVMLSLPNDADLVAYTPRCAESDPGRDRITLSGESLADSLTELAFVRQSRRHGWSDFYKILPSCVAVRESVSHLLHERGVLERVECLPVRVESERYVVLNPLTVVDDFDDGSSEWFTDSRGNRIALRRASFDASKLPSVPLFKIWPWKTAAVLALVSDDEWSLPGVVAEHGLVGLDFRSCEV